MFTVDEVWLTRNGNKVKVTSTNFNCDWYPIEVQNIVTNEKYTVSKEGRWEIYYDHEDSAKDLIQRIE